MKRFLYCLLGVNATTIAKGWFVNYQRKWSNYPLSRQYYEEAVKRLNTNNQTTGRHHLDKTWDDESVIIIHHISNSTTTTITEDVITNEKHRRNNAFRRIVERFNNEQAEAEAEDERNAKKNGEKSENFEISYGNMITFADIGGFQSIKGEMLQCVDMLKNWEKYARFSVRTPKGLVLEGPPGNGKTMLARGFAGEADVGFIAVSGAEFQDKYIGVGSSKVRELFTLANENRPCIIFIDEIDALGRKRNDGDSGGNAERDNTLNQLLVEMDGFRNNSGIFVIGATNRADLLDPALMRPGRIDKRIYVGMPDIVARRFILDIHIKGKPNSLSDEDMVELVIMTAGFSGSQIENLLNEAMLLALKEGLEEFNWGHIETIYGQILGGTQSEEHIVNDETLERICVHEMGHSLIGLACKYHPLMKRVMINLKSPRNPGMTIFEDDETPISTYEGLFERISVLYGGRIAELLIYGEELISTGASTDYEEAREIAQKMVIEYGMGKERYGGIGENSKERVNAEIEKILSDGYAYAFSILQGKRDCIVSGANILKKERVLTRRELQTYLML